MSDQPQAITHSKASHPFDDPSTDLTLRTPDLIEFYVQSHILSYASPVFSSMLSLPQPEDGSRAQRPVIDVSEDSQALDRLLRLCYPVLKPKLSELEDIVPVLKAALKYEMEWPVFLLSKDLLAMIPSNPLKVWAAACRAGLEDVAREAASEIRGRVPRLSTLEWNTTPLPPPCALDVLAQLLQEDARFSNLQDISAGDYFRLREFLRATEPPSASFRLLSPSPSSPVEQQSLPERSVFHPPDGFLSRISSPDVLLQCNDQWDDVRQHRAHGVVLALHSAVLGEQLAQAKADAATGSHADDGASKETSSDSLELPVLRLDVTSDTLVSLLSVCYDSRDSLPSSLAALASMLNASHDLRMSKIHPLVAAQWAHVAKERPLEAYFIAIQYGLHDQSRAAARSVVGMPLAGRYVTLMEKSSSLSYHRLLVYYDACAHAVEGQLEKGIEDWESLTQGISAISIYGSYRYHPTTSQTWMESYLRGLKKRVGRQGAGTELEITLSGPSALPAHLGTSLPKAIADAIAQVELEL
ncbi:hypothetical protein K466DRAFT_595104 [Polyporus arcularius HHB13444]|uniref:BTB domain-containing protein n=1 Tax=Polyporus arcularius HHB13444 TaxID=1314778 RepID=A0A5C3PSN6_9APHY|nr:hypothetical protein K466DRAFT_595104 [Polyporus arcularius HHB13444]